MEKQTVTFRGRTFEVPSLRADDFIRERVLDPNGSDIDAMFVTLDGLAEQEGWSRAERGAMLNVLDEKLPDWLAVVGD